MRKIRKKNTDTQIFSIHNQDDTVCSDIPAVTSLNSSPLMEQRSYASRANKAKYLIEYL